MKRLPILAGAVLAMTAWAESDGYGVTVTPEAISFTEVRSSQSEPLTIGNSGAAEREWNQLSGPITVSLLIEDFEGNFPPPGWTRVDAAGQCPWLSSDDYGLSGWTGTGRAAAIDSDACGAGTTADASLVSPALNLSNSLNTTLSFDLAYRHLSASLLSLDVSTDGATWTTIESWSASVAYPDAPSARVSFDLSDFDGQPEIFIRWRYTSGWDWWAVVDNVQVTVDVMGLLIEDFEGNFPPPGWTRVDATGQCPWLSSDDYGLSGWTGTGRAAAIDSDACGAGTTADASLVSPALNLSNSLNTILSFDLAYRHLSASSLSLDVSTDGAAWTTIESWSASVAYPVAPSVRVSFDLSDFDGQPEIFIRWRYTSGWDWWAVVDNVQVTAVIPDVLFQDRFEQ